MLRNSWHQDGRHSADLVSSCVSCQNYFHRQIGNADRVMHVFIHEALVPFQRRRLKTDDMPSDFMELLTRSLVKRSRSESLSAMRRKKKKETNNFQIVFLITPSVDYGSAVIYLFIFKRPSALDCHNSEFCRTMYCPRKQIIYIYIYNYNIQQWT